MTASGECIQYAIYKNPSDYPGQYVVRKWTIVKGATIPSHKAHAVRDSLEDARNTLPHGLACIPRLPQDDAALHEVWV